MRKQMYFDYMATTPIDPRVIQLMLQYMGPDAHFGNPASITHTYGHEASAAVELAREKIAEVIGALAEEICFTSGATESNNLAILGAARFYQRKGRHLITMSTEHKAVLDSFQQLAREGFEVTYLDPKPDGLLDIKALEKALRPDTVLVSVMHVNNEIGVIQNLSEIADCIKDKGILFHVDAAQSIGRLAINLKALRVDLMSLSAHKVYGPKGIGALYVRQNPRVRLQPQSYGGGHEGGLRSGTLPTHQIVGMGEAYRIAELERVSEQARILSLRNRLWDGIAHLPGLSINGSVVERIAGNLNLCFEGISNSELLIALKDLAISTTSACVSSKTKPSYVLKALGLSEARAQSSVRLTLGRFTTDEEVMRAVSIINQEVSLLRKKESI